MRLKRCIAETIERLLADKETAETQLPVTAGSNL